MRLGKEKKLGAGQCLETREAKRLAFEDLDAGFGGLGDGERGWGKGFGYCMDTLELILVFVFLV